MIRFYNRTAQTMSNFLNPKKMKRVLLILTCVLTNMVMMSCTNDSAETTPSNNKIEVVASDPNNPIPVTKPR